MNRRGSQLEIRSTTAATFSQLRNDYDAARPSIYRRFRPGVMALGSNADYHYRTDAYYFGMMELGRELFRNHALVGQGIRRLVANVIQGGFTPDPKTGDEGADDALEARFKDWAEDRKQCDVEQQKTFIDLQDLALQHVVVDGDILPILPVNESGMQLVEGHRCRTPSNSVKNIIHGVQVDNRKRRLGFYLTKDDVGLNQAVRKVGDTVYCPADNPDGTTAVAHLYRPDRISQTRGTTALAPPADTAGMGDDLMFAMLVKAQAASCWGILHEFAETAPPITDKPAHGEAASEPRPDGTTRWIEGASPGMEYFGYQGERLQGFSPAIPNPEFFTHANLILTIVAVNLDLPLHVFLLDPSQTNFSGWRGAIDQAKRRWEKFQSWLVQHFHNEVYRWKVRQWIDEDPALQRLAEKRKVNLLNVEWQLPGWPYIEPLKDISADVLEERTAQNSPRRIQAKRGRNFWDVCDEIVADNTYRISAAKKAAAAINKKFDDGQPVHWREVISLPSPEGITIQLAEGGDEPAGIPPAAGTPAKKEPANA